MSCDGDLSGPRERMGVLDVPVSIVNLGDAVSDIVERARCNSPAMVFVREVASLMLARSDKALLDLHHSAFLVVPDGMPLVWIGRAKGHGHDIGRVAGADLVDAVCRASLKSEQKHFFYGGQPGVAEKMVESLSVRYPGLRVAGIISPPMRDIGADFGYADGMSEEIAAIRDSGADFVWVGISSPKQEYWMSVAAPLVGHGVFLGVGAAFDFQSGAKRRAPRWMQAYGMEWLYRLYKEPRRLWYRYLVLAPQFVVLLLIDLLTANLSRNDRPR